MKNVNFDSLTNIKAPESWIENALNIPAEVEKKKPLLFFINSRALAAVACLIFVSIVSITIYLKQDTITPPVDPNVDIIESVDDTESSESSVTPQHKGDEDDKEDSSTSDTEIEPTESVTPTAPTSNSTSGSEDATQNPIVGPTRPTEPDDTVDTPTELPEPTESPEPTVPTKPNNPTTKPSVPYEPPTVTPTVKPTVAPTEPPPDEAPDVEPEIPGIEPSMPSVPSNPPEQSFSNIYFGCSLRSSLVPEDNNIYCMVYDSNGYLLGDSNLYSAQHKASIRGYSNGKAIISYRMPDGLIQQHGNYTYYFYDKDGVILYSNVKYI